MNRQILILDDCSNSRENYQELLELEGFQVFGCSCPKEALHIVSREIPELIICDIKMSEMDGFRFIQRLKARRNASTIPFIFHSAVTEPPTIEKAMKLGASAFLRKPCPTEYYIETVHYQLDSKNSIS